MFLQKRFNTFFVRLRIDKKDFMRSLKTGDKKFARQLALKIKLKYEELKMTSADMSFIVSELDKYVKEILNDPQKVRNREEVLTAGSWEPVSVSYFEEDYT